MARLSIAIALPVLAAASQLSSAPPSQSSLGCGKALPDGQSIGTISNVTISTVDGPRNFLVSIPPNYTIDAPTPVILSYHGGGRDASDQLQLDELTNPAFNSASFVIYPQGIKQTWQGVPNVVTNDVRFTADILDHVQNDYCIDINRISATGKSDGGGFCNVLACDSTLSSRIAAFAPVSGAFYINSSPCRPSSVNIPCNSSRNNIPFLEFHGGNDSTIDYDGGPQRKECLPAIPHFIQQWAKRDNLDLQNTSTSISSNTISYKFGTGANAGLVEHIYDSVIGHDWPSLAPNADNQRKDHHVASFNATPILLEFFKQNPLNSRSTT